MARKRERADAYHQQFAERIIQALKDGTAPWQKPRKAGERIRPHNFSSGRDYRGGNAVYLAMQALDLCAFDHPRLVASRLEDPPALGRRLQSSPVRVAPNGVRVRLGREGDRRRLVVGDRDRHRRRRARRHRRRQRPQRHRERSQDVNMLTVAIGFVVLQRMACQQIV